MYTKDMTKLEVAQNFCLKYIQALPRRTRPIIVQNMINVPSIQVHVDIRKMRF